MPNRSADSLFLLIRSLEKSEKRNFKLYVKPTHTDFISQFLDYPSVGHDDIIETVAVAVEKLSNAAYDASVDDWGNSLEDDDALPKLTHRNLAP